MTTQVLDITTGGLSTYASASLLGLRTDGTDQSIFLNQIFQSPSYSGVVIDFPAGGALTILSNLNCNGKAIKFIDGNRIIGQTKVDSGVYDMEYNSWCFDSRITHTNARVIKDSVSVKNFGASGMNISDDQPAIQRAIDTVITNLNLPRKLTCPPGDYKILSPIFIENWNGISYGQHNIEFVGQRSAYGSPSIGMSRIIATSITDTFAIGVMQATGGIISGIAVMGPWTLYNMPIETYFTSTWSTLAPTLRDSRFSPSAAICIDYASNGQLPPDGGYPGLSAKYRGDQTNGGTTAFLIEDCQLQGFTTGICNSPNGYTQQGEDCIIRRCQMDFCKVAIVYGQSQSDNCKIIDCRSWYYTQTCVDAVSYGTGVGTIGNIDGWNVVGAYQLFNIAPRKSFEIRNIHAESIFQIGTISAFNVGGTVTNMHVNFAITPNNYQPAFHASVQNITFKGCCFRYYDDQFNKRLRFQGWRNSDFDNVVFDMPPYSRENYESQFIGASFRNCPVMHNNILGAFNNQLSYQTAASRPVLYGQFNIQDDIGIEDNAGGSGTYNPTGSSVYYKYDCTTFDRYSRGVTAMQAVTVNPDRTAKVSSRNIGVCQVNDVLLDYSSGDVFGRISAVDPVNNILTISEVPLNFNSGTYQFNLLYFVTTGPMFIGDIAKGDNRVLNASEVLRGSIVVEDRIEHLAFQQGTYISAYDAVNKIVTLSTPSRATATHQNFLNGYPEVLVRSIYSPTTFAGWKNPFATGTKWIQYVSGNDSINQPNQWNFVNGGYIGGTYAATIE